MERSCNLDALDQQLLNVISDHADRTINGDCIERISDLVARGADVNAKDNEKRTVLMHAALTNRVRACAFLIEKGAAVNEINNDKETALHCALRFPKNTEVIKVLIAGGADVNQKDGNGRVPLMIFLMNCSSAIGLWSYSSIGVQYLLAAGADCNYRDETGSTPLMKAAFIPDRRSCELLLQYGADPEMRDTSERRACDCVGLIPLREEFCAFLRDPEKIRQIVMREDNPCWRKQRKTHENIVSTFMMREIG